MYRLICYSGDFFIEISVQLLSRLLVKLLDSVVVPNCNLKFLFFAVARDLIFNMEALCKTLFVGIFLVLLMSSELQMANAQNSPQQQVCPEQASISPCICTVKKNGLDILCETTDLAHIAKAMGTLKGKSPIIFYLKLRHNNLPKLQGFVFLALDIRHLTIHNSSLAAIEENALSSLGKMQCHL